VRRVWVYEPRTHSAGFRCVDLWESRLLVTRPLSCQGKRILPVSFGGVPSCPTDVWWERGSESSSGLKVRLAFVHPIALTLVPLSLPSRRAVPGDRWRPRRELAVCQQLSHHASPAIEGRQGGCRLEAALWSRTLGA